ncbi:MAG: hypothetical protein RL238_173 [Actinomycetota bacterium]|jgi:hypothetical protein
MNPPLATPMVTPTEAPGIDLDADVARFFATVKQEQARFLHAFATARGEIGDGHGQLAQISAIQCRLTRQFFDAQRLIMERRAEVDAEVARIAAETEEHANVVLAAAVANVAVGAFPPPVAGDRHVDLDDPDGTVERTTRSALHALSVLALRTQQDTAALEHIINDAFEPAEADGARAERELRGLLDEWWERERNEGRALVEDARARAAMRLHLAHIEACEIAGSQPAATVEAPVPTVPVPPETSLLPAALLDALDGASPATLDATLARLTASLDVPAVAPSIDRADNGDVLFRLERAAAAATTAEAPPAADHFQHFWSAEPAVATDERRLSVRGLWWRVVFPVSAVTSGLALVLALVG